MYIAKSDNSEYIKFDGSYHLFKTGEDCYTLISKAKYIDKENDFVYFLKENGNIEPSYETLRKYDKKMIYKRLNLLFFPQTEGQISFKVNKNNEIIL